MPSQATNAVHLVEGSSSSPLITDSSLTDAVEAALASLSDSAFTTTWEHRWTRPAGGAQDESLIALLLLAQLVALVPEHIAGRHKQTKYANVS